MAERAAQTRRQARSRGREAGEGRQRAREGPARGRANASGGAARPSARQAEAAPAAARRAARRTAGAARRAPGRRGGIRWDRVGRHALLITLGVIVLLYAAPAKHWIESRQSAAAHDAELRELSAEHHRLERRVRELRSPGALEREARRLGMVREGERPFVLEGLPRR